MSKDMKICIIFNPKSGESHKFFQVRPLMDIVGTFSEYGYSITIKTTSCAGEATTLASESIEHGYTHIIACGGDGTINEVINAIAETPAVLGIIPMGTENVLAKALEIPMEISDACRHFINADEKSMDLGIANGRYFIMMSGIGFDARIISEMEPELKNLLGSLSYLLKGVAALITNDEKNQFKVKIKLLDKNEDYEYTSYFIAAANIANYSGTVCIAPQAVTNDGKLNIIVFPPNQNIAETAFQIFQTFTQTHLDDGLIPCLASGHFIIETEPPVYYQIDGELAGKTPIEYEVKHKGIKLKV